VIGIIVLSLCVIVFSWMAVPASDVPVFGVEFVCYLTGFFAVVFGFGR
jgi:hypothetical protein